MGLNLSDFEKSFYSDKELKEIESGIVAYDKLCTDQEREELEYSQRPFKTFNVYEIFEGEDLDTLMFLNEEISFLVKLREKFIKNKDIKKKCEHLIIVNQVAVDDILEDIKYDRRQIKTA